MRRMLPPIRDEKRQWDISPYVTSPYGQRSGRPPSSSNPHGGVDFNYIGNVAGTFNNGHPAVHAPVTGIVTNAGRGKYGTIAIRDANGYSHEILHTHDRHVAVGDAVVAGQLIGTMGDTGVVGSNPSHRHDHVHYQLKDPAGNRVNPTEYWDQQDPVDPNPAPPAHLSDYQRYLGTPGSVMSEISPNVSNARPLYASQRSAEPSDTPAAPAARKQTRYLARITGMSLDQLGDALKAAFQAGIFQTDAYAPFAPVPSFKVGRMNVSLNTGLVTLPDGSQFDLKNSRVFSVLGKDHPVLSVWLKDGTTRNFWTNLEDAHTLFKDGIGKWNLDSSPVAGAVDVPPRVANASPGVLLNPVPTDSTAAGPFGTGEQFAPGSAASPVRSTKLDRLQLHAKIPPHRMLARTTVS